MHRRLALGLLLSAIALSGCGPQLAPPATQPTTGPQPTAGSIAPTTAPVLPSTAPTATPVFGTAVPVPATNVPATSTPPAPITDAQAGDRAA